MLKHIPVKTFQGIGLNKIVSDCAADWVVIIGSGVQAKALAKRLLNDKYLADKFLFVENDQTRAFRKIYSVDVIDFPTLFDNLQSLKSRFLIIDPPSVDSSLILNLERAEKYGAQRFSWIKLSRPEGIIEIASSLDSSKRIENRNSNNQEYMPLKKFSEIFRKLSQEFEELHSIDLSGRCDPITHPNLNEIIEITSTRTFSSLITKLDCELFHIHRLAESLIDQIIVDFSDIVSEKNLYVFLERLNELNQKATSVNNYVEIRCRYQKTKNNFQLIPRVKEFCMAAEIRLIEELAYPDPYEKILEYAQNDTAGEEINEVLWDVDTEMSKAVLQKDKPCLCQRVFPVINYKGAVEVCHLYVNPKLSDNYLKEDLSSLIQKRAEFKNCQECQKYGLHRLDLEVLNR